MRCASVRLRGMFQFMKAIRAPAVENAGGADWLVPAGADWSQILDYVSNTNDASVFDFYQPGVGSGITRDNAATYTTLNRCVTLNSGVIAQLIALGGLRVEDQSGVGVGGLMERRAIELLTQSPDGESSAYAWHEDAVSDYLLDGNVIVAIDRDFAGKPMMLRRMVSYDAEIYRGIQSRRLMYRVRAAEYVDNSNKIENILDTDIIHSRWGRLARAGAGGSRKAGFATPPVKAMRPALEIGMRGDEYIRKFFNRGEGGIKSQLAIGLERNIRTEQRDSLADYLKKYMSSQMPLIMGGKPTFTMLKSTPQDAEAEKLREFQVREVARVYGIPAPLLGEQVTQWGAGIEQLAKLFWRFGARQHLDRYLAGFAMKLLKPGLVFRIDDTDLLRGDSSGIAELIMATLGDAQRDPVATVAEARHWAGLPKDGAPPPRPTPEPMPMPEPMPEPHDD